tara:strand:+ start:274 stop:1380 length:1107 start_codon:yes stop_codon:yes gene_type:complete
MRLSSKETIRTVGLMSGTSMDGLDIVVADINLSNNVHYQLIDNESIVYPKDLRKKIRYAVYNPEKDHCALDDFLGKWYADTLFNYLESKKINNIDLIGSHGQTIHHISGVSSLQIGNPEYLVKKINVPVVSDFRSADIVAGGTGAPLMPKIDEWLFRNDSSSIITLNIGGIANVTFLPSLAHEEVVGFDTGPGMSLLDEAYLKKFNDGFDVNGQLALKGNVNRELVSKWLTQSYFIKPFPKSTGRDQFGINWLNNHVDENDFEDQLATLSYFTAKSIFIGCEKFIKINNMSKIIVSGGGAHHQCIMKLLKVLFNPTKVIPSSKLDICVDSKEALGFAIFAVAHIKDIPGNIPSVTGAKTPVVLGKITL